MEAKDLTPAHIGRLVAISTPEDPRSSTTVGKLMGYRTLSGYDEPEILVYIEGVLGDFTLHDTGHIELIESEEDHNPETVHLISETGERVATAQMRADHPPHEWVRPAFADERDADQPDVIGKLAAEADKQRKRPLFDNTPHVHYAVHQPTNPPRTRTNPLTKTREVLTKAWRTILDHQPNILLISATIYLTALITQLALTH